MRLGAPAEERASTPRSRCSTPDASGAGLAVGGFGGAQGFRRAKTDGRREAHALGSGMRSAQPVLAG